MQEKSGFIPNVMLKLDRRPEKFRACFGYCDALVSHANQLTKAEKEMIITATSAENHCLYCVLAHSALLRIYEKKPRLADQIAINRYKAEITPRQLAMIEFAVKVSTASHLLGDSDFDHLHTHGFSNEDIWDIAALVAF